MLCEQIYLHCGGKEQIHLVGRSLRAALSQLAFLHTP